MDTSKNQPKKRGLIIGISEYNHLDKLDFCKKDGEEMYQLLTKLGFEIPIERKLIGRIGYMKMHNRIIKFFKRIPENAEDILLFYFSGHGVPDEDFNIYLASSETEESLPSYRGYSFDELTNMINQSTSKRIVTILDCCHSGQLKLSKGSVEATINMVSSAIDSKSKQLQESEGKYLLSASLGSQRAYELQEKGCSIFTHYLLEGLKGDKKALNSRGDVSAYSLGNYVYSEIVKLPEEKRQNQKPVIKVEGGTDLVLASYKSEQEDFLKLLRDGRIDEFNKKREQTEWAGIDLTEVDLSDRTLMGADLRFADLRFANLQGANLEKANLEKANLTSSILTKAILVKANLENANLTSSILRSAKINEANLRNACLKEANLMHTDLVRCDLTSANLFRSLMQYVNLTSANLSYAMLNGCDLERANLTSAILISANLSYANLVKADLTSAKISHAKLFKTNVEGANMLIEESKVLPKAPTLSMLLRKDNESYSIMMYSDSLVVQKRLPITQAELDYLLLETSTVLGKITANKAYSSSIDIPPEVCDRHLKDIANLNLFNKIFVGKNPTSEDLGFAHTLRDATQKPSYIQIISELPFIPWMLLYDNPLQVGEKVDRDSFWGLKHVIEQIPVIKKRWKFSSNTKRSDSILSFNAIRYPDDGLNHTNYIDEQIKLFSNVKNLDLPIKIRTSESEILEAFAGGLRDTIVYLYLRANIDENGDPSFETLSSRNILSLDKLIEFTERFVNNPLIFINTYDSENMSIMSLAKMMSIFRLHSRGGIWNISNVPSIFAGTYAVRFFTRFLEAEAIGNIIIDMRNEFLHDYNNLLGLYYVHMGSAILGLDAFTS